MADGDHEKLQPSFFRPLLYAQPADSFPSASLRASVQQHRPKLPRPKRVNCSSIRGYVFAELHNTHCESLEHQHRAGDFTRLHCTKSLIDVLQLAAPADHVV